MDLSAIIGLCIALGAVLCGQLLEGGHVSSILQPTAALIVLGGTAGAVTLQFPMMQIKRAFADLRQALRPAPSVHEVIATLVGLSQRARREGIVSLERDAAAVTDPVLRRALELAIDGLDAATIKEMMELQLDKLEEEGEAAPRLFEAAGGYAPTVGIIGAVLGLIHVMENLSDPSKLGSGIAVAFVATVYGVGLANLLFLPLAGKLKIRARENMVRLELIVESVASLALGENPRLLERRLAIYVEERTRGAQGPSPRRGPGRLRSAA